MEQSPVSRVPGFRFRLRKICFTSVHLVFGRRSPHPEASSGICYWKTENSYTSIHYFHCSQGKARISGVEDVQKDRFMAMTSVTLHKFTPKHVEQTFLWLCDPELRRLFLVASAPTRETNGTYWERNLADSSQKIFAIIDDGVHVGNCGFKNINREEGSGELWMYLGDRKQRGRGRGTAACRQLLDIGRDSLGLRSVYLHVAELNRPAVALYEKCGFTVNQSVPPAEIWAKHSITVLRMDRRRDLRVAMMQPAFMPWLGYFALMAAVDVFVLLDDFVVSPQSHSQRNRILTPSGAIWVTAPLTLRLGQTFNETHVCDDSRWRKKTAATIAQAYRNHPHAGEIVPFMEEWIGTSGGRTLMETSSRFISHVATAMSLRTAIRRSSEFPSPLSRSGRVFQLLESVGASLYRSAFGSFGYMRSDGLFPSRKMDVQFIEFTTVPYRQKGGDPFVPNLSAFDAVANVGGDAARALLARGATWLSWEERAGREDGQRRDSE